MARILVDGKWVVGDGSNSRNGFVIVNKWDTNSFSQKGTYIILPF